MPETLSTLSIISFVVAGIMLALAIVLWFFFEIPTVIGDLTGRTAKKSIAKMRAENEKAGIKKYKEGKVTVERGKVTEKISGRKGRKRNNNERPETGLLVENRAELINNTETGFLKKETSGLLEAEETEFLLEAEKTEALQNAERIDKRMGGKVLTILEEVILIHTDEIIEC